MPLTWIAFLLLSFFLVEILYFQIARYFSIVNKPKHEIYSAMLYTKGGNTKLFNCDSWAHLNIEYCDLLIGFLMVAMTSFVNEIVSIINKVNFANHSEAALSFLKQLNILKWNTYNFLIFSG